MITANVNNSFLAFMIEKLHKYKIKQSVNPNDTIHFLV